MSDDFEEKDAGQENMTGDTADQDTEAEAGNTPEEQANEPEDTEETGKKPGLKKTVLKEIKEWAVALVTALVVVFLVHTFLFTIIRVDGESMYPTLNNNERLFVTVLDVRLNGVQRDDIVICHYPNRGNTYFVKRVVGVPGDTICRKAGVTYVNGEALDPDGLYYQIPYDYDDYTLGEDEYFVVGDNRYNSHDSRDWKDGDASSDVGPISGSMICGKVRTVIWPLSSIRSAD